MLPEVHIQIYLAIAAGMATLGVMIWQNRTRIEKINRSLFGHTAENGGKSGEIDSLGEKMDRVENKLDDEQNRRRNDFNDVQTGLKLNRFLLRENIDSLVAQINNQSDVIDLDKPDTEFPEDLRETDFTDERE